MKTNIILLVALMSFMMVSGCGTGGSNDLYTGLEQQAKIVPLLLSEDTDRQIKGTNLLEKSPTYPSLSDIAYEYQYEFELNYITHMRALSNPIIFLSQEYRDDEPTDLNPPPVAPPVISSADSALSKESGPRVMYGYEGEGTLTVNVTQSQFGFPISVLGTLVFNNYATDRGTHINGSIKITGDEPMSLEQLQDQLVGADEPKSIQGGFASYLYTYTNFSTTDDEGFTRTFSGTISVDVFDGEMLTIETNVAYREIHEGYENSFRDVTRWVKSEGRGRYLVTGRIYNEMLGGYTKVAGYVEQVPGFLLGLGFYGELTFTGINGGTATSGINVEIDVDGPGDEESEYYRLVYIPRSAYRD